MTFEESYRQYPFAGLVALGISVTAMIVRQSRLRPDAIVATGGPMEPRAAG